MLRQHVINFQEKDFIKLKDLIEEKDNTKINIDINELFNTIWLKGNNNYTELYLKSYIPHNLIIARIGFKNTHNGIGTEVLNWLINFIKDKNITSITIESVSSESMIKFCNKHNFIPDKYSTYEIENLLFGNYIKKLLCTNI